jgi:hypothetical protein
VKVDSFEAKLRSWGNRIVELIFTPIKMVICLDETLIFGGEE